MAEDALQDLVEMEAQRPDLTEDEWTVVGKAMDWMKQSLRPEVRAELEIENIKWRGDLEETLREDTKKLIAENMEEWRKSQTPLSDKELGELLQQEYIDFPLEVRIARTRETRKFTICELSAGAEKRFIESAKKDLIPLLEEGAALEWGMDKTFSSQFQAILNSIPGAIDVAAELVAICLDPWKEDETITAAWCMENISVGRMTNILVAQGEANRYRDFLSNGSRLFLSLKTR